MAGCRPVAAAMASICARSGMALLAAGLTHAALGAGMRAQHAAALETKLSIMQRRPHDSQVCSRHCSQYRLYCVHAADRLLPNQKVPEMRCFVMNGMWPFSSWFDWPCQSGSSCAYAC